MIELDHVLLAVSDLDAAATQVEERLGLVSVKGGRHQGLGTANRIVPLGETYPNWSPSSTKPRPREADSSPG